MNPQQHDINPGTNRSVIWNFAGKFLLLPLFSAKNTWKIEKKLIVKSNLIINLIDNTVAGIEPR